MAGGDLPAEAGIKLNPGPFTGPGLIYHELCRFQNGFQVAFGVNLR